ncbi:PRC-barrel domain protein [Acidithiobacillus ferrivorans SS3]|uniref:PRC-barrel domain protein n=1 Tax=Acidithiobacillus ferrivorans SS3 TaxID=743299 RepID=G0JMU3_9PROT|nr:PRC-barrel domain-containing protein [Acidithiobacillus ferrivorans]AEM48226.1 PRC-barrel domain protein [Acidithiobacillus ferrivorans SS3]OFA15241.1 hypothetical protein A4U49_14495 [Acidithiobacillus ferrivorans]
MAYTKVVQKGITTSAGENSPAPAFMGAETLIGSDVYNHKSENIGSIKEIMLNLHDGKVAYAVLSFGGFLGMGEKLFAKHITQTERAQMGRVDSTLKYLSQEIMDTTDTLVQPLHELGLWYRALRTGWRYFSRKH